MAETLLLIDASSSIFRAFFALPPFTNSAGIPTNATLGFTNMLLKTLRDVEPDYVAIAWDAPGAKRRKQAFPDYKANRDATSEDLKAQFPYIRRIVDALGLSSFEFEGEEADDVIATLATRFEQPDIKIVSTDKDLMQLVSDRVVLLDTAKNRTLDADAVEERFGVAPDRLLDVRALVGDSADNIPGVRGVGEKTAAKLIQEFGSLDALLDGAEQIKAKGQREKKLAGIEDARLSRELSRLRTDLPLDAERVALKPSEPDSSALTELYRELEFKRLLEELGGAATPAAPAPEIRAEIIDKPAALKALVKSLQTTSRSWRACGLEGDDPMRSPLYAVALGAPALPSALVAVEAIGEDAVLDALRDLFEDAGREWVGFDLKRDAVVLGARGVELTGRLLDATLAAYVADPSQPLKPELLARVHLGMQIDAADDGFGRGAKRKAPAELGVEQVAPFAAAHLTAAGALVPELQAGLEDRNQQDLYADVEVPLVGVLARMEQAGVRVDEPGLTALEQEIDRDLAALEERIYELGGESFTINSPKQLQGILFEKLKLPPGKRTKTGFSTDESVLEELSSLHDLPRELLSYRRLSKLSGTYVEALPKLVHPETGRIHCRFHQTVAATGRLSASRPNLQNIPIRTPTGQRIREMFIPAEGRVLVSADYSQIELRILAHFSEDRALVEAFECGEDIHIRTASDVFGVAPDTVTPDQRSRTKAINFGIIYGSSAFGLARQLGIGQSEAAEHIKAYFERYPGVRSFLDQAIAGARERGFAETLFGRRRYLPDRNSRNRLARAAAERLATNSVIQGTAADVIKRAMIQLDADLRAGEGLPAGAQMILQVHDELVFEVVPEAAEALTERVCDRMEHVPELSVPVKVHAGTGQNWLEAH